MKILYIFLIDIVVSRPKLGILLENKASQKLKLSKSDKNKKR